LEKLDMTFKYTETYKTDTNNTEQYRYSDTSKI
jgi:hypothetical protein